MVGIEHGNVTNEEFMERAARYEYVYNRNSKNFKDKNTRAQRACTFDLSAERNVWLQQAL